MNWYPQALLTAEQACRRRFFLLLKNDTLFEKLPFFDKHLYFYRYLLFMHIFENTK